jgi:hypothetical protein
MKKPIKGAPGAAETRATGGQQHADGGTTRAETPELEGRTPLPEEITGKASGTDEALEEMFDSDDDEHLTDGFRGGSEDEPSR